MNTDQTANRAAQPADEELKKHGDQLAQQVKDAAGKQPQHMGKYKGDEQDQKAPND